MVSWWPQHPPGPSDSILITDWGLREGSAGGQAWHLAEPGTGLVIPEMPSPSTLTSFRCQGGTNQTLNYPLFRFSTVGGFLTVTCSERGLAHMLHLGK